MAVTPDLKNYRLLIVDDSDFARTHITALLTERGFTVVGEAASAEDALRQVKEKKPHLVITDIVMPNISGVELTEKITSNFSSVGVIVISSLTHEQVVLDAIGAGAVDFLKKPVNPDQLVESVEKFLTTLNKE